MNEDCKVIYGSAFEGCNSLNYNEYNNACYLGTWTNKYFALIKVKSNGVTDCEINPDCKIVNNGVFNGCASLTSVTIPDGIISLGADMFSGCEKLTNVTLPNSVVIVGNRAFQNCTSLTSVKVSEKVNELDDYTFEGCSSLTSVTMGEAVNSIRYGVFRYCTKLTEIHYGGTKLRWENKVSKNDTWKDGVPVTCMIHCSDETFRI